jgi:hypothetical protein
MVHTSGIVVADVEDRWNIGSDILETGSRAVNRSAAD